MIKFPIAKINLGLNIVERRPDGYHNLETVFYPVNIKDALEVTTMDDDFPSLFDCYLKVTNIAIEGDEQKNLVVKAYNMIAADHKLPRTHAHLYKAIPTQAGMGGGSSDCAYMIRLINEMCALGLSTQEMMDYAARLGADCAYFILDSPARAEGIGEILKPISLDLSQYYIGVVRPDIPVSTKEAFSTIVPKATAVKCWDIVKRPVVEWRDNLVNDFEQSIFPLHPELGEVKQKLYDLGALYASMSGSGSSLFGIFDREVDLSKHFTAPGTFVHFGRMM